MAEAQLTGLQLVAFRDVLENVVQSSHAGLQELVDRLPALADEERKRQLLQHLQTTRQRLQRLHVCAQWAHKAKAVNTCREVLKASQDHGTAFVHAADELFRLHEELRFSRVPLFDVSTALHIMQTGNYRLLPSVIEDELAQPGQRLQRPGEVLETQLAEQQRDALRRVDFLLRSKLLAMELPAGMRVLRVRRGQATVAGVGGQYTAQLTLVPTPRDDVILAKYRPPGDAGDAAGALREEPEVQQPAAAAAAADEAPSTSAAAQLTAGGSSTGGAAAPDQQQQRQGPEGWRWQLLSLELLPAMSGQDPPVLQQQQAAWLQQHIEQRMWAAGDVEQLVRLGKAAWVAVPQLPTAEKSQSRRGGAPAPSASQAPSQLPASMAVAAADGKGKQPVVKEEPVSRQQDEQQQQRQQEEEDMEGLPLFARSPLEAMHGMLCQTAGRLALFSILLIDARQLEAGSWKGSLKLSRASTGSGIRLAYWHQLPSVSYAELQCLQEGQAFQSAAERGSAAAPTLPQEPLSVDVSLRDDGCLAASSSPQLQHPVTGAPVHLPLPLNSQASLDAGSLLSQAAACSAAVHLAAVQAVLQRGGRLASAGCHIELVLPQGSSAGSAASVNAVHASPQLLLWSSGSVQLSLSVQLRSGRLLLAAGPHLLESEQGGSVAAAVAVTQQQLDASQRDALTQPLPAGSTRGMLAARLAAEALARLSLQLTMRQQVDAAAADAAACGLRRAALPHRLLQQHFQKVSLLLAPLSANVLTLALPSYPPPADMQHWARRQQQQQSQRQPASASSAVPALDIGATRCFLLLDFGHTAAAAATKSEPEQQNGAGCMSAGSVPPCRVLLAVCSCTSRGTVTRVLSVSEVPEDVVRDAQARPGTAAAAAAMGVPASNRKRRADSNGDSAAPAGLAAAAIVDSNGIGRSGGGTATLCFAPLAAWCRRQASWAALRAQMQLLPVKYSEDLVLSSQPALGQLPPPHHIICLPKAPVLAELEAWASAHLVAAGKGGTGQQATCRQAACQPVASLQLEPEEAQGCSGCWRVDIASSYFASLQQLLQRQGVALAPPAADAPHMDLHSGGLTLRYSLREGHSVLTAVTDMARVGLLHLSLVRLAGCMAANPLAAAARALAAAPPAAAAAAAPVPPSGGENGALKAADVLDFLADSEEEQEAAEPANGSAPVQQANGKVEEAEQETGAEAQGSQHPQQPSDAPPHSLLWPLPGCGSLQLLEAGISHMAMLVAAPPLPATQAQQQEPPPPVRVTVSWASMLASAASHAAASSSGNGSDAASSSSGTLKHIRCCVACQPPLPPPLTAALAEQLQAGRPDLFLDSLCLMAHSAAAVEAALTIKSQRAAGLLPGAVKVLSPGGAAATSSALRLRVQLQQGDRAATLCLSFHAAGYTLLQLQPAQTHAACAAAASWLPPLWQRLADRVPSFAALDSAAPAQPAADGSVQGAAASAEATHRHHVRQAWVHSAGIGAALAEVMHALSAPPGGG
ncbi:Mediator of RNA polymerase II transcription subunit 14 [Chlorella vulgaris]